MKKKNIKRMVALGLAVMLSASALAGCGNNADGAFGSDPGTGETKSSEAEESSAAEDSGSGSGEAEGSGSGEEAAFPRDENGYPDLQGETITIWYCMTGDVAKECSDIHDFKAVREWEEKFNCTLEFQYPPVGQEKDNFSIMMAGGEWPDIIVSNGIDSYYPGGVNMAIEDGVVIDPTPYINETNTPNFLEMVEKYGVQKLVVDDDGRMIKFGFKISGSKDVMLEYAGPMIRRDYLEAANLEVPVTVDDWYEMLTAMKANGVEYPFALSGTGWLVDRSCNFIGSAYGVSIKGFYVKEDGSIGYGMAEPGFKGYLETMNKWYSEGLINPDFMNQNNDDVQSLMASGTSGAAVMHLGTYRDNYYQTTEKSNPDAALVPAQYPVLNEGDPLTRFNTASISMSDGKYITTKAKNPLACIYFLDALYNPALKEGLKDGEYVAREDRFQGWPDWFPPTEGMNLEYILKDHSLGAGNEALNLWKQGTEDAQYPSVIHTTEEAELISKYQADLDTYVQEMFFKFITGAESLDNFDSYITRLDELHLQDLIAVKQAAYDRYMAR